MLLGLGIRELSMAPGQIASVRSLVRGTALAEAQALTAAALALPAGRGIRQMVTQEMVRRFPMETAVRD